ncbi:unnamed protein product, partial [Polarella glacialis]
VCCWILTFEARMSWSLQRWWDDLSINCSGAAAVEADSLNVSHPSDSGLTLGKYPNLEAVTPESEEIVDLPQIIIVAAEEKDEQIAGPAVNDGYDRWTSEVIAGRRPSEVSQAWSRSGSGIDRAALVDAIRSQTQDLNSATHEEVFSIVERERKQWEDETELRQRKELAELLDRSRSSMCHSVFGHSGPANQYGNMTLLPEFVHGIHVPVLALINPTSGAGAGRDILKVARRCPYYQNRFFDIIDVVRNQRRGGMLDVFRLELIAAKEEAKALKTRPRLISGGGDGTGSFSLFILFLALKADNDRSNEGLADSGNGFIWSDEEMGELRP